MWGVSRRVSDTHQGLDLQFLGHVTPELLSIEPFTPIWEVPCFAVRIIKILLFGVPY